MGRPWLLKSHVAHSHCSVPLGDQQPSLIMLASQAGMCEGFQGLLDTAYTPQSLRAVGSCGDPDNVLWFSDVKMIICLPPPPPNED